MENEYLNELVEDPENSTITELPTESNNTQIFLVMPSAASADPEEDSQELDTVELDSSDMLQLKSVEVTKQTVSASDASGLKASVLSLIGDYETIVTDYTYQNYNGSTQHSIDVQPDYAWCASALIFLAVLWSCLKMFSIALRGNHRR